MRSSRLFLLCLALLGGGAGAANAGTIVSVAGSGSPYLLMNGVTMLWGFAAAGWSQAGSYQNVAIEATLNESCCGGAGVSGTAYLLSQLGPAATPADEIARISFSDPNVHSYTSMPLFSGLTLGPGSYYLLLTGSMSASVNWQAGPAPTVITDAGVTRLSDQTASYMCVFLPSCTTPPAYVPDANFAAHDFGLSFEATGDAAGEANVPELSVFLLIGSGVTVLTLARRRYWRS